MSVENLIDELIEQEQNVGGAAVVSIGGELISQTENWNLSSEIDSILNAVESAKSTIVLLGMKYMVVENTPERIIGTNIQGKGHLILAPFEKGVLVTYIIPQAGPRDALFNVQSFAQKINAIM
jgi:predicted regulator of Ras-like GTPase activity (Roadblock/LC7/MglB family)